MAVPDLPEIRRFILTQVSDHPLDIVRVTVESFGITRQAVHRHLAAMVEAGLIEATGKTRQRRYALKIQRIEQGLSLEENPDEDAVWRRWIAPELEDLPDNVRRICHYGFTEMYNNAVDHSEGTHALVSVERSAVSLEIRIADDGVGIFQKLKSRFDLDDERHAILELSKGKLTTDPKHHSGQGIFFTSRMFDNFNLHSGRLWLLHEGGTKGQDWLLSAKPSEESSPGTFVTMRIATDSPRTTVEIFNRFADPEADDYGFTRTHVPLILAQYGQDELVSRSQARRVLARFDRFKMIVLDFRGIESIGQAFADEIFRVFARAHPDIELLPVNASEQVNRMIHRALYAAKEELS